MKNVWVAFDVRYEGEVVLVGYQEIRCHPKFDIKMTTLTQNVCFVVVRHMMYTPADITYASVVFQESVHIALLIVDLNDLDVLYADVQNTYLNTPPREKAWFKVGPEFG